MERKEAIEVIKKNWPDSSFTMLREALETLIPELKESEDERTWIINYLSNRILNSTIIEEKENLKKAVAWLEKQGGQKPADFDETNAKRMFIKALERVEEQNAKGYKLTDCDKNSWWEDFKAYCSEQNLANSAKTCKDEQKHIPKHKVGNTIYYNSFGEVKSMIVANVVTDSTDNPMYEDKEGNAVFEKDLIEKNSAWSEEDEKGLGDALWCCKQAASIAKDENDMGNAWFAENWLKSLKERYTWKPSDEQMNVLDEVIRNPHLSTTEYNGLIGFMEQLKKLREE